MSRILLAMMLFVATLPAWAADDQKVTVVSVGKSVEYTLDELESLGSSELETSTTWTDGAQRFQGVLLSRIAEEFGVTAGKVVVRAINDYEAVIEVAEILKYPVLLATRQNGERMPVRDKGPAWIVYPRDQYSELAGEEHNYKWVWQVMSIRFE